MASNLFQSPAALAPPFALTSFVVRWKPKAFWPNALQTMQQHAKQFQLGQQLFPMICHKFCIKASPETADERIVRAMEM